jgi:hypothetical protein
VDVGAQLFTQNKVSHKKLTSVFKPVRGLPIVAAPPADGKERRIAPGVEGADIIIGSRVKTVGRQGRKREGRLSEITASASRRIAIKWKVSIMGLQEGNLT